MGRSKKRWRTLSIWLVISLVLQFGAYAYINKKVQTVLDPVAQKKPPTQNLTADIPGTGLQDIQLSFAKDYVAYKDAGVLKVYNLKQKKVVFTKAPPAGGGKNMGVLDYEWLPDRNTLIYFYAHKNPNPVTYTTEQPPAQAARSTKPTTANISQQLPKTDDPNESKNTTTSGTGQTGNSTSSTSGQTSSTTSSGSGQTPKKATAGTQNQVPKTGGEGAVYTPKPIVVAHYGNPQLTDLYTLTLPESSDTTTEPDDRFNQTLSEFPAGGEIEQMAFSTFTNLMYLTVKTDTSTELLRIDVMKEVEILSQPGETITDMAVSDRFGTLYIETEIGGSKEIVALDAVNGWKRTTISENPAYTLLGERNGTLYLGELSDGNLVKLLSVTETSTVTAYPNFHTVWTGSIPFQDAQVQVGTDNQVIIYNSGQAYVINNGQLKSIALHGSDSYISADGAELVQMTPQGAATHFVLQPLED